MQTWRVSSVPAMSCRRRRAPRRHAGHQRAAHTVPPPSPARARRLLKREDPAGLLLHLALRRPAAPATSPPRHCAVHLHVHHVHHILLLLFLLLRPRQVQCLAPRRSPIALRPSPFTAPPSSVQPPPPSTPARPAYLAPTASRTSSPSPISPLRIYSFPISLQPVARRPPRSSSFRPAPSVQAYRPPTVFLLPLHRSSNISNTFCTPL